MSQAITRRIMIALGIVVALVIVGLVLANTAPKAFSAYWFAVLLAVIIGGVSFGTLGLVIATESRPRLTFLGATGLLFVLGLILSKGLFSPKADDITIIYVIGAVLLGLSAIGMFLAFIEFALMPLLGIFRLGAISRVTYYEALFQPFTLIILVAGICSIGVSARLPFFTYDEDFKMFRDVATSFVFLFSLPIMIFASTKVIDEEIENRTMLTLMSKPVARWQVILGKYLGVLMLALVCIVSFGIMAALSSYLRYYDDYILDFRLAAPGSAERIALEWANVKAFYALMPGLVLAFLQVATLAALSVALSTRWGLAVNVTVVVMVYIVANMVPYFQNTTDLPGPLSSLAAMLGYLLPSLGLLDLNQRLVFGNYILDAKRDAADLDAGMGLPSYGHIWQYVGICVVYAIFYIGASLAFGMALFRSRELT